MNISYGKGRTEYGPGVEISLTGEEVAIAIGAYLEAHQIYRQGPRTITVNGALCESGSVYVDPSGFVIDPEGNKWSGRGANKATESVVTGLPMTKQTIPMPEVKSPQEGNQDPKNWLCHGWPLDLELMMKDHEKRLQDNERRLTKIEQYLEDGKNDD